jgi:hypothetical protein
MSIPLTKRIGLCWRILRSEPGNLLQHAERELPSGGDEMQALMNSQLKEMILVFSTHGHSGFSASYARQMLDLLLQYKPLGPLTGEASEWNEVGPGVFQNNRCSRVFKSADRFDGQAYDIDAKVFREPSGACYTNSESAQPVVFPYTPATEYVDVPEQKYED